jgi:epoxyqueuosine reductase
VPALAVALNDEEPLVRGHAAWALGRIGTEAARQALGRRAEVEVDAWVREEICLAVGSYQSAPTAAASSSLV